MKLLVLAVLLTPACSRVQVADTHSIAPKGTLVFTDGDVEVFVEASLLAPAYTLTGELIRPVWMKSEARRLFRPDAPDYVELGTHTTHTAMKAKSIDRIELPLDRIDVRFGDVDGAVPADVRSYYVSVTPKVGCTWETVKDLHDDTTIDVYRSIIREPHDD